MNALYIVKAHNGASYLTLACIAEDAVAAAGAFQAFIDRECMDQDFAGRQHPQPGESPYRFDPEEVADVGPPHYSDAPLLSVHVIHAGSTDDQ